MNGAYYAAMARRHWEKHLPERVAALADPDAFFAQIGQEAYEEIQALLPVLEAQHAAENPPGTSFLARAGQMSTARALAEQRVLPQMVLLDPEADPPS